MVRIAPDALDELKAIAAARKVPVWKVLTEAARRFARTAKS